MKKELIAVLASAITLFALSTTTSCGSNAGKSETTDIQAEETPLSKLEKMVEQENKDLPKKDSIFIKESVTMDDNYVITTYTLTIHHTYFSMIMKHKDEIKANTLKSINSADSLTLCALNAGRGLCNRYEAQEGTETFSIYYTYDEIKAALKGKQR